MQRLIAEPHTMGDWTRISPMFERPIYRRRTNETQGPGDGSGVGSEQVASLTVSATAQQTNDSSPARKSSIRPNSFNTPFESLADILKDQ
jgi:hypothetical protein